MAFDIRDLKESNAFLNVLLDNINSAVLILDPDYRIRQFNTALKSVFGKSSGEVAGKLGGEALGCAFSVNEKTSCGLTSKCGACKLRNSAIETLRTKQAGRRKKMAREFIIRGMPVLKFLEFSTRFIEFGGQEFALLIIDDITAEENRKIELMRKRRQLDSDLKAAGGIQKSLLPSSTDDLNCNCVETAWWFQPCSHIGGDIFNLFELADGRLGCYMMDVSGHGVSSALVSVAVSRLLPPSSNRLPLGSPALVCEQLDRQYAKDRFNGFISMIYMVLDPAARTVCWCNAGHPPAVLARSAGDLEVLAAGCPIIGLGGMLPFREDVKEIGAGDRILLYTDGLIERRNASGSFWGLEGLLAAVREAGGQPLDRCLSDIVARVMDFGAGAPQADDISLLGLEIK